MVPETISTKTQHQTADLPYPHYQINRTLIFQVVIIIFAIFIIIVIINYSKSPIYELLKL